MGTIDLIARWDEGGRQECLDITAALIAQVPPALPALTHTFHILIQHTIQSPESVSPTLSPESVASFALSLLESSPSSSVYDPRVLLTDVLLDLLWTIDAAFEPAAPGPPPQSPDIPVVFDPKRHVLATLLAALVTSGVLAVGTSRDRLDWPLLFLAGLGPHPAIERRVPPLRTKMLYKQQKYNLLREQSQGWSKFITEIIALVGPQHDPASGYPAESQESLHARAQLAWDKIIGLIGFFDLDPNRAVDVLVDIFSMHVVNHHHFFLELFRISTWTRRAVSQRSSVGTDVEMASSEQPRRGRYEGRDLDDVLRMAEHGGDDIPDPKEPEGRSSSEVLGQIIGFKFAFFQADPPEKLEYKARELYYVTALLIREGLLRLEDVYPHLSPADENMNKHHERYKTLMREKTVAAQTSTGPSMGDKPNALSGPSRPLRPVVSTANSTTNAKPATSSAPSGPRDPPNQKTGLLRALLHLGALRPSLFIMSKFPWITNAHPELADALLHFIHVAIAPLTKPVSSNRLIIQAKNTPITGRIVIESGQLPKVIPKRDSLTKIFPPPPDSVFTRWHWFYAKSFEHIPLCETRNEIWSVIEPLMRFVGVNVCRDIGLSTQLCRIGRSELQQAKDSRDPELFNQTLDQWRTMLRLYILPSLSITRANVVFNAEVWSVLKYFTQTDRWGLYGEWATVHERHPEVKVRHVEVTRETRSILRRVTVGGKNRFALPLAKLAHSNPLIVFGECVKQAMAYENLIDAIAEAANNMTTLGYDVLVYILLSAFSNSAKPRMKDDGTSVAMWLENLSTYNATIFHKYGGVIESDPILQFLAHRLRVFRSADLIILHGFISKTTSIDTQANLTDDQVVCMSGGSALRIEAIASEKRGSGAWRLQKANADGVRRMKDALERSGLAVPLLVLVAQQREFGIEKVDRSEEHLKHISNLYDECQAVLFQLVDFLITAYGPDYAKMLPSLETLCLTYNIRPDVAFHLWRPALHGPILEHNKLIAVAIEKKRKESQEAKEKQLKMALAAKRGNASPAPAEVSQPATPLLINGASKEDANATPKEVSKDEPSAMQADPPVVSLETLIEPPSPWLPQLEPLMTSITSILPSEAFHLVNPGFYVTFWQLSMYDLTPPMDETKRETVRLDSITPNIRERSQYDYIMAIRHQLTSDLKAQIDALSATQQRLQREKDHWFAPSATTKQTMEICQVITQHGLLPRSLLSPVDAEFCAKFIKTLHTLGTPSLSTLRLYDNLFGLRLGNMIFSLSEHQTNNFGRFYRLVMEDISAFSNSPQYFKDDNKSTLPGFTRRWPLPAGSVSPEDLMDLKGFRSLFLKWQHRTLTAINECFDSNTYVGVRNAIIFLSCIAPVYPRHAKHGRAIEERLVKLQETEKRPDLVVLLKSYTSLLGRRKKEWLADPLPVKPQFGATGETPTKAPEPAVPAVNGTQHSETSSAPKNANGGFKDSIASIPRPDVVKRIGRDNTVTPPAAPNTLDASNPIEAPSPATPAVPTGPAVYPAIPTAPRAQNSLAPSNAPTAPASVLRSAAAAAASKGAPPTSPRADLVAAGKTPIPPSPAEDTSPKQPSKLNMPPPSAPSSTPVAQGLREKQDTKTDATTNAPPSRPRTPTEPSRRSRSREPSVESKSSRDRERERDRDSRSDRRSSARGRDARDDRRDERDAKVDDDRSRVDSRNGSARERDSRGGTARSERDRREGGRRSDRRNERPTDNGYGPRAGRAAKESEKGNEFSNRRDTKDDRDKTPPTEPRRQAEENSNKRRRQDDELDSGSNKRPNRGEGPSRHSSDRDRDRDTSSNRVDRYEPHRDARSHDDRDRRGDKEKEADRGRSRRDGPAESSSTRRHSPPRSAPPTGPRAGRNPTTPPPPRDERNESNRDHRSERDPGRDRDREHDRERDSQREREKDRGHRDAPRGHNDKRAKTPPPVPLLSRMAPLSTDNSVRKEETPIIVRTPAKPKSSNGDGSTPSVTVVPASAGLPPNPMTAAAVRSPVSSGVSQPVKADPALVALPQSPSADGAAGKKRTASEMTSEGRGSSRILSSAMSGLGGNGAGGGAGGSSRNDGGKRVRIDRAGARSRHGPGK